MKNCASILLLCLSVALLVSACSEKGQDAKPQTVKSRHKLSVAEARQLFESQNPTACVTRGSGAFDQTEILASGQMMPDWDSSLESSCDVLSGVDVPFEAEYDYLLVRRAETEDDDFVPMLRRLVVVSDPETGETVPYLRFSVPDAEYGDYYPEQYYEALPTCGPKANFSGLLIYATLSGFPACVGRFENGSLCEYVFVTDTLQSRNDNLTKMASMLEDVYVARVRTGVQTRGVNDNNKIDAVECVATGVRNFQKESGAGGVKFSPGRPPIEPDKLANFGNGGGGCTSGSSGVYEENKNIKYKNPKVEEILDLVLADCMGQLLIGGISKSVTIETGYFHSSRVESNNIWMGGVLISQSFTIKMGSRLDDVSLMEELIHIHQMIGNANRGASKMNDEIEAKLGWFMYRQRIGDMSNIANALGGKSGFDTFDLLSDFVENNDTQNPKFLDAYEQAARSLRTIEAYKDVGKVPLNPDKMDFKKLMELMKDCLKKK